MWRVVIFFQIGIRRWYKSSQAHPQSMFFDALLFVLTAASPIGLFGKSPSSKHTTFEICPFPNLLAIQDPQFSPNPVVKGELTRISFSGASQVTITPGAKMNVVIKLSGLGFIPLMKMEIPICKAPNSDQGMINCPHPPGMVHFEQIIPIDRNVPNAKYTGQIDVINGDGTRLGCVKSFIVI